MYSINKKYWFTIEPYTYTHLNSNELIAYNTLNNYLIRTNNCKIIELIKKTQTEENLSVSHLDGNELQDNDLLLFIKECRENFMCDLIDQELSEGKPIQFISKGNLILNGTATMSMNPDWNENLLSYLNEVSLIINSPNKLNKITTHLDYCQNIDKSDDVCNMSLSEIRNFYENIRNTSVGKIKIMGSNISIHPEIKNIINYFNFLDINVEFVFNVSDQNIGLLQQCKNSSLVINIKKDVKLFSEIKTNLSFYESVNFIFIAEDNNDLDKIDEIVSSIKIKNYQIHPFYNGQNLPFFEMNVYLEESEICLISQEIKVIHAKHMLNTNDFGKLIITPNGKVYSNLYLEPLGTITDDIRELVYKEMDQGTSWRRIRDMKPCCDCVYQWLCPSPSNYELAVGKANLCHVKP